jgi:hypothetical protein
MLTPLTKVFMSKSTRGLSEKGAALLSYVLGWLIGLIIFLIDKRPYVRVHAAQSIVVLGGLHVIQIVIAVTSGLGWGFGSGGRKNCGKTGDWNALNCWRTLLPSHAMSKLGDGRVTNYEAGSGLSQAPH